MSKLVTYVSSRNNYSLLKDFIKRNPTILNYNFHNVDDNSSEEQKEIGREICKQYDIKFIENKGRGLQWAAKTMVDNVDSECKFILWTTHDTFTITENFYEVLENDIPKLKDFGIVGFNILGPQCGINSKDVGSKVLGIIGRAPLANLPGRGGWYRTPDMNLPWDIWGGSYPIAIESPTDMILSFNVELFKKYIKVSDNYHLFCAWDDISIQFLEANTYNVVLPYLQTFHNQEFKRGKIPVKSAAAAKQGDEEHFGRFDHFIYWKERWGWERDDVRNTFPLEKYKGTLIGNFYEMDWTRGPLRRFDNE